MLARPCPVPIPGVTDRDGLAERLRAELSRARRRAEALTVLHVDLVDFAGVNARCGRAAGDDVLRRVGLGMAAALRGEDLVARVGGDSFAVVLPGLTGGDVDRVVARLVAVVDRVQVEGVELPAIRVGVGSAAYPADADTVDELLATAAIRQRDAREARRAARRHRAVAAPPPPAAPRWPWRRALWVELALFAVVAAAWLLLPLALGDGSVRRTMLVVGGLAYGLAFAFAARRTEGRERVGWALFAAVSLIGFVPVAQGAVAVLCGVGGMLVAADGWLADRFRRVDALCFTALAAGGICAFALPSADALAALPTAEVVSIALRVVGTSMLTAAAVLIFTSVSARARPDVWWLAAGFAAPLLSGVLMIHWGGERPDVPAAWLVIFPLAMVNGIVAAGLRLQGPRRPSRALRAGQ
ncbi:MAG TPA: diguanylate cyclase, partial [Capillimicrobium sp.]